MQFEFNVKNTGATSMLLYFFAGIYTLLSYVVEQDAVDPFAVTGITNGFQNTTELVAAGHAAGYILDDGALDADGYLVCTATDPKRTIKSFINYVMNYPSLLKQITIVASDEGFFAQPLRVGYTMPLLPQDNIEVISLQNQIDEFASMRTRAKVPFVGGYSLERASLMYMTILAGKSATFTFDFYKPGELAA